MKKFWKRLRRNKAAMVGFAILIFFALLVIVGPYLTPYPPDGDELSLSLLPPGTVKDGNLYIMGTDYLGRDILTRIIYGGRISILVGICATIISLAIGVILGLVSGLYGRWLDSLIMRVADVQLSFPFILLAVVAAALLEPNIGNIIIILALSGWVRFTRLVRGEVLVLREREFVQAARAVGTSNWRIILRHLLPNCTSSIIVMATLELSRMVIMEATLGFLGLGIPAPTPTWGGMLSDGRTYFTTEWWLSVFPGLSIFFLVFGVNLVGDWLRDFFDPKLDT